MGLFANTKGFGQQPEAPPIANNAYGQGGMGGQSGFGQNDPYGQGGYYGQQGQPDMSQAPPDTGQMQPPPDYGQPYPADQGGFDYSQGYDQSFAGQDDMRERVEEVAEAIIDEKWNELMQQINKVIEWKERTDTEIKKIAQEIINLKERFESLHKGVLGKITEYDQNLTNVGTEIKAMEKVFQNILPTFTENVNKLERITKSVGERG